MSAIGASKDSGRVFLIVTRITQKCLCQIPSDAARIFSSQKHHRGPKLLDTENLVGFKGLFWSTMAAQLTPA